MNRRSFLSMTLFMLALFLATRGGQSVARAATVADGTIEGIDRIAAEGVDQKKVASYAVAVVKDGQFVLARGYGFSDLENDVPATAESVYRLGSITKQFTAMAIMQLAEQGKLSVDDELTKFLPEFPTDGRKITVHQLLNHTSGIKSYTSTKDFFSGARQDLSHEEMLALFKDEPRDFEPGAKWLYNNSGYYLLGMIIEKASGDSYAKYLEDHIFRPLGMSAARYGHTKPLVRHRAMGYEFSFGKLSNADPISMTAPGAAGALVSNVLDLVKWHQALEQGALVSSASYEAMYRPTRLADDKTVPYGYGWGVGELAGHRKLSHGGGINGFSTMIARYPDDRLAVIVLSNTSSGTVGKVESRIAKLMLGIEDAPIVDLPTEAALIEALVGKYQLDEAKVEISTADGKLFARLRDESPKDRLQFQGNREFVSTKDSDLRITFSPAEGKAEGFELEVGGQKLSAKRVE